jgi:hypothetical protein
MADRDKQVRRRAASEDSAPNGPAWDAANERAAFTGATPDMGPRETVEDEGYVPNLKPGEVGFTSRPHRPAQPKLAAEVDVATESNLGWQQGDPTSVSAGGSVPLANRIEPPHKTVEELMVERRRLDEQERQAAQGRRDSEPSTADTGGVTGTAKREEK